MTDWFAPSFWVGGNPFAAGDASMAANQLAGQANMADVQAASYAASAPTGYNPVYNSPVAFGDYNYGTVGGYPSFGEASGGGDYQTPQQPQGDPNVTPYDDYGPQWLGGAIDPMTGAQRSIGTMGMNDMGMPPSYGTPSPPPDPAASFADRFPAIPQSFDNYWGDTGGRYPSTQPQRPQVAPPSTPGNAWDAWPSGPVLPERRGMAIGIDPMTGETIFSGGAMNSMNAMPGGVPTPQPRPADAPSDFGSRFQFQTPTPQARPADAPPMTTTNPVSDRWDPIYGDGSGGYGPGDRGAQDQMRDAIARQVMQANNQSWMYGGTSPTWGTRQTQVPDTFTSYPYNDTLTPNNTVQYRFPNIGDPTSMLQKFLDDMDRGTARQELGTLGPDQTYDPLNTLRPSDYTTPYQPGG